MDPTNSTSVDKSPPAQFICKKGRCESCDGLDDRLIRNSEFASQRVAKKKNIPCMQSPNLRIVSHIPSKRFVLAWSIQIERLILKRIANSGISIGLPCQVRSPFSGKRFRNTWSDRCWKDSTFGQFIKATYKLSYLLFIPTQGWNWNLCSITAAIRRKWGYNSINYETNF